MRTAKRLCHLITTKCEINDDEGGALPPDISFDDDDVGNKNIVEDDNDKAATHSIDAAEEPPVVVALVAQANGVLAPLPQNISSISASCKRTAFNNKSNDIMEMYKIKMLQREEDSVDEPEHFEWD
jgi:hypothetical protein